MLIEQILHWGLALIPVLILLIIFVSFDAFKLMSWGEILALLGRSLACGELAALRVDAFTTWEQVDVPPNPRDRLAPDRFRGKERSRDLGAPNQLDHGRYRRGLAWRAVVGVPESRLDRSVFSDGDQSAVGLNEAAAGRAGVILAL